MTSEAARTKRRAYLALFAIETLAAIVFVTASVPLYGAVMSSSGHQLLDLPESPVILLAAIALFHCAYWYRLRHVPLVLGAQNHFVSHIVLFAARINFVFGTAFFALVVFRHLPGLTEIADPVLLVLRFTGAVVILFSVFCYSAELERIGLALRPQ
ncbi:MAG: hypothetical protein AB7T86_10280 [Xanthobacteraceae bacterium]|uniref:hypothetical protein n=1 Tax=Pseudolabrys sp. TaxID=1960880 RepID=UPI003D0C4073